MVTYIGSTHAEKTAHQNLAADRESYAALDLGTNNCRLLVAIRTLGGFKVTNSFSRIVRLGEGLSKRRVLSEEAMSRTIVALQICADKMKRSNVHYQRSVATAACRYAENCDEFIARVYDETELELEIISGAEEARLALAGCVPLFNKDISKVVGFDIGGGSTELVLLEVNQHSVDTLGWISLPVGVVSLTELYGSDLESDNQYTAIVEDLNDQLAPFCTEHQIRKSVSRGEIQMVGTSGTVTTLAAMDLGLPRYDRSKVDGAFMKLSTVLQLSNSLRIMDRANRVAHPCIGEERCEFMIAGCAILEAICNSIPIEQLRVADRGVREGILLELMHRGRVVAG